MATLQLSDLKTMRDINDYCVQKGIPSLAQGMIELPPPLTLREIAAEKVMDPSIHTYRARIGETEYREAMKYFLKEECDTNVTIDNILASQGVSGGIVSSLALLQDRGGTHIGIIEPFYTYHIFQVKRLYGKDVPLRFLPLGSAESEFAPDWKSIEMNLKGTEDVKKLDMLIVCNPGNPTGRVWSKEELDRLVMLTKENNCMLLLDECYSDFVWQPKVHYSPIQSSLEDHVVVARGFSKVLGCQSWRVGYTISSAATIAELMKVQDPIYICVPWLQHALGKYFQNHLDNFREHKQILGQLIQGNYAKLSDAFAASFGWKPLPSYGSMYGMMLHNEENDMAAVKKALDKGVGVCPGSMFFANFPANTGFIRIHCGVSEEKAGLIISNLNAE